jgi:hypothetical protein
MIPKREGDASPSDNKIIKEEEIEEQEVENMSTLTKDEFFFFLARISVGWSADYSKIYKE